MLHQHLKLEAQPRVLDACKAQSESVLNGLINDSCNDLTGEKILEIDQAEKIKVKIDVNQQNFRSQYMDID